MTKLEETIFRLEDKVQDNDDIIDENITDIAKNTADITANTTEISTNSEDIANIKTITGECIDDHNSLTGEYCGEWVGATLKKVPVWGDYWLEIYGVNFEWPTEEMWADMSPDTKVESIEFYSYDGLMRSAQVSLSSGESTWFGSSLFANSSKRFDFDPNVSIGKVEVKEVNMYAVCSLTFYDRLGTEIDAYTLQVDPIFVNKYDTTTNSYELKENEEIVGVYGVKTLSEVVGFGFIVK